HPVSCAFHLVKDHRLQTVHSFPTRRSSDLDLLQGTLEVHAVQALVELEHVALGAAGMAFPQASLDVDGHAGLSVVVEWAVGAPRSEEHTSELQSREKLVCRLLLEKKKNSGY